MCVRLALSEIYLTVANIVARAIEFEGEWPAIGGIRGNQASFSDILELGPRIRGK